MRRGATLGANCTVVCGTTIGRYAFVAAGAVVAGDVPDYALMIGVPARRKGWMCRCGVKLAALATGGRLVVIGLQRGARAELDLAMLLTKRARIIGTTLRSRPHNERAAIVAEVGRSVWPLIPDKVRPVIHGTVPFDDAQAAHDLMENGKVFGKVVLVP